MTKTTLKITNIQYDLDGLTGFDETMEGRTKEQVLRALPKTIELNLSDENRSDFAIDEEGLVCKFTIQQHLEKCTNWLVKGFEISETTGDSTIFRQCQFKTIAERMRDRGVNLDTFQN